MEIRSLEDIWSEAKSMDISCRLTDRRLAYLSRIHLAIHSLIVCTHPEEFREEYTAVVKRIDWLFDKCLLLCQRTGKNEVWASFIPLLYRLGLPEYQPVNSKHWEKCDRVADRVINWWVKDDTLSWENQHNSMRAVTELFNGLDIVERQNDPAFQKHAEILARWQQEASGTLIWEGISCREVLSRLELFCRNSTMQFDNTYDEWILSVYNTYRPFICIEEPSDEVAFLLLALEEWTGQPPIGSNIIELIQTNASKCINGQRNDTDEYWAALSVLTECLCIKCFEPFQP